MSEQQELRLLRDDLTCRLCKEEHWKHCQG
jgi:hypothetical protein